MSQRTEHEMPLTFELTKEQVAALRAIAGNKRIRISGYIDGNKVKVDCIATNEGIVGPSDSPFRSVVPRER